MQQTRTLPMKLLVGFLSLATLFTTALGEDFPRLYEEQLISDLHLNAKEFLHYYLMVTSNIYKGDDHLTISAFETSYGSDPDIYISKTTQIAYSPETADVSCTRDGSDTCIIQRGDFNVGSIFVISVFCMEECTFDLKAYYAPEIELQERKRQTYRWGGHSTAMLKYYVPKLSGEGFTDSFQIKIQPERPYTLVDVYVSYDDQFNIVEDKPAQHLLSDGVSITMNEGDYHWCKECYIYLIVVMVDDMRLYVTADAQTRTQSISGGVYQNVMVNQGEFQCFQYSIGSINNDVLFGFSNFQGNADLFIARRNEPSTENSSAIKMNTVIQYPRQIIIISKEDRVAWEAEIGQYYLCAKSYAAVSAEVFIQESDYNGIYGAHKEHQYTFLLDKKDHIQLIYEQDEFWNENSIIHIEASVWTTEKGDKSKLKIFFELCVDGRDDAPCGMSTLDASGESGLVEQVALTERISTFGDLTREDVTTSLNYIGKVEHDHDLCRDGRTCKYIFSIYNPSPAQTPRKGTFMVSEVVVEEIQDIEPGKAYRNTIQMGQYIYYRILDSQFNLEYIEELRFDLLSYIGDADLFISTSRANQRPSLENFEYQSRNLHKRDQVIIRDSVNDYMTDYIYIAIYGNVRSDYELEINTKHHPHFNERLEYAIPIHETESGYHMYFAQEWDSMFVSYQPWWSMHEDRTIVFLADSFIGSVDFYFEVDDYPLIYNTDLVSNNEMYIVTPWHKDYTLGHGHLGTYYIRIRPRFALSSLVVNNPYETDFFAFSQPTGDGITDIYADQVLTGAAWRGQNTYYRHFLTDIRHTVQITLVSMNRKGSPKLMVKFKNNIMLPQSDRPNTYDQKLEIDENNDFVQMWLHKEIRAREDPDCDFAGYYIEGGREYCGIYIGVECGEDDYMCAYRLKLELLEWTEDFQTFRDENFTDIKISVDPLPPRYIPKDQDYVDGVVGYQEEMQFYYPIVPEQSGDILILANKTAPLHKNGDISLSMNIQADSNKPYTEWTIPTGRRNTARSRTFDPVQPEIINMSEKRLKDACGDNTKDCSVLINVRGEWENFESHFRIKVFNGTNRLYPNEAVEDTLLQANEYKYYWFVSTAAMAATKKIPNWLHEIGLGIKTPGMDVDMYVSVMDGRFPTEEDCDYKSVNLGSDWVTISNNDTLMQNENYHSWNPRVGMVVVVGVKARSNGASAYSLVLKGPNPSFYDIKTLMTNDYVNVELDADLKRNKFQPYFQVYKWYNWQHVDFKLNVKLTAGAADFYLNKIGETNYEENAISGIPLSIENSQWHAELNKTSNAWQDSVTVLKIDTESYPQFCYNCWYYLTVKVIFPGKTTYRVFFQELSDSGSDYLTLEKDFDSEILIEEQGERKYCRFMLDSTDSFEIVVTNSVGFILVHVSQDPDSVDFDPIWSTQFGVGSRKIEVAKDDARFHMATWYYVSIQSLKGSSQSYIKVKQDRNVQFLANGYGQKFQFFTDTELVKFMTFQVPSTWSEHFETTIEVEPLGDYIYPSIYLKKVESQDTPDDFVSLPYPSIVDYDLKFGDNFSYQLYNDKAVYKFTGTSSLTYTYYTMAVYSNSYGMTDVRKQNFKLTVTSYEKEDPNPRTLQQSSEFIQ